nr:MAG TPA_asm: hypothetical protein [Caudoviricetes sp.]
MNRLPVLAPGAFLNNHDIEVFYQSFHCVLNYLFSLILAGIADRDFGGRRELCSGK